MNPSADGFNDPSSAWFGAKSYRNIPTLFWGKIAWFCVFSSGRLATRPNERQSRKVLYIGRLISSKFYVGTVHLEMTEN